MEVPRTRLGGVEVPYLLIGTSPLIAAGQFGVRALEYYVKFVLNRRNTVKLFTELLRHGAVGVQLIAYPDLAEALYEAVKETGVRPTVVATLVPGEPESLTWILRLEAPIVLLHASITDTLDLNEITRYLDLLRDQGLVTGLATHTPRRTLTTLRPHLRELGTKVIMAPLNSRGLYLDAPREEVEKLYQELAEEGTDLLAKKVLGAGTIPPEEAIPYIVSKPYIKAIAVGITSVEEYLKDLEILRKVWKSGKDLNLSTISRH